MKHHGCGRLCTGRYHDVAPMSFVYCVRPCRICGRRDGYRLEPWGAYVIRRSILFALPCPPTCLVSPAHIPVPWYGVRLGWRAMRPLCRGHEVACRPRQVLPPLIRVATYDSGSTWRGVRVYALRPRGLQSICQLADLDQLEAAAAFSSGYLPWP